MLDQHVVAAAHNLTGGSNIHTMCLGKVTKFQEKPFKCHESNYRGIILQDS